ATPSPKDDIVQFVVPRIEIVKKGLSGGSKLLSAQVLALILQKLGPSAASSISRKTEVVTEAEREAEEQEELDELEDQVEEESEGQTIQEACDRLGEDGGEGAQTIQQFESVSRDPRWDEVVRVNMEWIMRMSEAMR